MPLPQRSVSPVNVSIGRIPPNVQENELECVANGTMANLMRQMSSLTQHAAQIFRSVHEDIINYDRRVERIHDRIIRIQENLANPQDFVPTEAALDSKRKAFKSLMVIDQHTFDKRTLPPQIAELYGRCEDPPNLNALNPYRDDTTDALKLYTNPQYFIDLWKQEMLKDAPIEPKKTARSARSPDRGGSPTRRRKPRTSTSATRQGAPSNVVMEHYQARINEQPADFMHFPSEYQAPQLLRQLNTVNENLPPPPGMSMQPQNSHDIGNHFQGLNLNHVSDIGPLDDDDDELPPPPPPLSDNSLLPHLNSPSAYSSSSSSTAAMHMTMIPISPMKCVEAPVPTNPDDDVLPPPPMCMTSTIPAPPPPPPPPPASMSLMTSSTIQATSFAGSNPTAPTNNVLPTARVNLLSEIQAGMKLRKTQQVKEKEEQKAALDGNNVAAILHHKMITAHLKQRSKKVNANSSDEEDDDDDDDW